MATPICCIPDCDEPVRYYHLQVCAACYSGLARWRGRNPAQKRKHFKRCERLVSRMGFVMDNPRHHPRTREEIHAEMIKNRRAARGS